MLMSKSISKSKRRWNNIHFSVTNKDISVASETFNAFIFMHVIVVSIKKISMTDN